MILDGAHNPDAARAQLQQAVALNPVTVGHGNIKLRPEWYGLWVLGGNRADEIGAKINEIGFYL